MTDMISKANHKTCWAINHLTMLYLFAFGLVIVGLCIAGIM